MSTLTRMEQLFQDLWHALRAMHRNPGFAAVAVLSLALGIGANSVIFTFINAALLKPLPYPNSDRIVAVLQRSVKAGKAGDKAITALALVGISLPVAWLGLMLRYLFAGENPNGLAWFPDGGYVPLTTSPWQWFYHLLLPWFTLAILFIGFYGRVLRSNILDTINEDFVRTAKAKGLSSRRILVKHTLRASLIPIVTLFGLDFAAVLGGGAIITETVYSIHGVGYYAASSIHQQDLPPLMGVTLYGAAFIVVFSTLVDVAYAYLDPRIRLA